MEIDHVHFYVEDAKVWRDWFVHYLGFKAVASGISSFHTCTEAVQKWCGLLFTVFTTVTH